VIHFVLKITVSNTLHGLKTAKSWSRGSILEKQSGLHHRWISYLCVR